MPKTAVLHVRVTPIEKRAIQQAAKRAKLTVSAWLWRQAEAAMKGSL